MKRLGEKESEARTLWGLQIWAQIREATQEKRPRVSESLCEEGDLEKEHKL